ncbi:MAG: dipeptide ABC transporter ATP-binding protein [Anaerolineales bacterium]
MRKDEVLIRVENLKKYFPIQRGVFKSHVGDVKAVDGVSFKVYRGETLGLVGESGCGKTTVGRTIVRLYEPTEGSVFFQGVDLSQLTGDELREIRGEMQMIFQNPYASLSPRMKVKGIIGEPLEIHHVARGKEKEERIVELLDLVGLKPGYMNRYPHEFSGGQRQRIGIARSLALNPEFVICDEPISSLDVSIQAQVVNLLEDLQEELGLTYLFIAHDLSMVRHISDRVAVMYLGKLMEVADKEVLFENPLNPYTQALMSAIPVPNPKIEKQRYRVLIEGDLPSPSDPPKGCNFNTRCPLAEEICFQEEPELVEIEPEHFSACHIVERDGFVDIAQK